MMEIVKNKIIYLILRESLIKITNYRIQINYDWWFISYKEGSVVTVDTVTVATLWYLHGDVAVVSCLV
jgi:hypothetical protein